MIVAKVMVLLAVVADAFMKTSNILQQQSPFKFQSKIFQLSASSPKIDYIDTRKLLDTLLSSRTSVEQKKDAYQVIRDLRQDKDDEKIERVLDEMLEYIERSKQNPLTAVRLPFPWPSFRIKVGSLRRLLQTSTSIKAADANDEENKKEKRRGLLIILGQLASSIERQKSVNIRKLEAEARTRSKQNDMVEMLKRTPAGLETPIYKVVENLGEWEVRKYDSFSVCSIDLSSSTTQSTESREKGGSGAFGSLAAYIFGKNKDDNKMAMTTPVIMAGDGEKMSFVMPSKYW